MSGESHDHHENRSNMNMLIVCLTALWVYFGAVSEWLHSNMHGHAQARLIKEKPERKSPAAFTLTVDEGLRHTQLLSVLRWDRLVISHTGSLSCSAAIVSLSAVCRIINQSTQVIWHPQAWEEWTETCGGSWAVCGSWDKNDRHHCPDLNFDFDQHCTGALLQAFLCKCAQRDNEVTLMPLKQPDFLIQFQFMTCSLLFLVLQCVCAYTQLISVWGPDFKKYKPESSLYAQ